jgi:hypothetical protein
MIKYASDDTKRRDLIDEICRLGATSEANAVGVRQGLSKLSTEDLERYRAGLDSLCAAGGEVFNKMSPDDRQAFLALSRRPSPETLARLNAIQKRHIP